MTGRPLHALRHLLCRLTWRLSVLGFFTGLAGLCVLAVAVYAFPYPVQRLSARKGAPLRILDRHGTLLRSIPASELVPSSGRWGWVSLDRLPPLAVGTVIASEDQRFFQHRGVDPAGIARACWLNLTNGRLAYGGSTITMQLARMVHSPGRPRTVINKVREAVWALRMERALSKRAILEQYLNRAYYGNRTYGLEAAARLYFGKPAAALSAGEATLLAVVPRGPRYYDPLRHLHRTLRRRDHVLGLLRRQGRITAAAARRAAAQPVRPRRHARPFEAPHFTRWVVQSLPAWIRAEGGAVRTSLDLPLQRLLQRRLAAHVESLRHRNLNQAGMVVLDTASGEVLAMVGSTGFYGGRGREPATEDGQINIATRRRHPGSALKPFVYALALEAGDSPATIALDIHDVPSAYRVRSLTQPEHGPVRYREALAGSYNLAAVHVLERVGLESLISRLRLAGVGQLSGAPDEYGLRLALGSTKVRLIDLASAYGFLVRGGRVTSPAPVRGVLLSDGTTWRPVRPGARRVFGPRVSWLVMDMLADPEARRPAFGQELPLDLPFRVAAKTGTARGFSDTVTVGVTRELTVAAWAGNFDGKATHGVVAMEGAAPLVRMGLLAASRGQQLTLPPRPAGLTTAAVCPLSGMPASSGCPHRKREHFLTGREPKRACTWHRATGSGLAVVYPEAARGWATRRRTSGGQHL